MIATKRFRANEAPDVHFLDDAEVRKMNLDGVVPSELSFSIPPEDDGKEREIELSWEGRAP